MILHEQNLVKALAAPLRHSVYYYFSTEEYLVHTYAAKTIALLCASDDAEVTRIEGPAPGVEEIVASAGTISFFGTKRIVELPLLDPSAMNDADVAAVCDVMQSLENAVLVITTVWADERSKTTKKAKQLLAAAEACGLVAELTKPQRQEAQRFAVQAAAALGAALSAGNAAYLVERCGQQYYTLENEVAKLAAAAGYGEITRALIARFGTQNIEADVFDMVRMVTAGRTGAALAELGRLLDLQNEPIAITAALAGAYLDMYRVKCGEQAHKNYAAVFSECGYRGNNYRLKKSGETAAHYTKKQLGTALGILCRLDLALKSSAASATVLVQTGICELAALAGGKR